MTDIYSVGSSDSMPPSDANAAGTGARGPVFRGMRRRRINPQTGQEEREVWVQGRGYLPEGSVEALPQEDQEWLQAGRSALAAARRNAQLGQQFSDVNAEHATGGVSGLPVPDFMQSGGRQRLEGLTNQMVRANIQPGQAGTMNSVFEQILARQQYPTTGTYGGTNASRTLGLLVDQEEIAQMLTEAEDWARQNRGLQGFEVHWTRNRSADVREAARQHYLRQFADRYGVRGGPPRRMVQRQGQPPQPLRGAFTPPPAAALAPARTQQRPPVMQERQGGGVERWERNPQTGRLERVR